MFRMKKLLFLLSLAVAHEADAGMTFSIGGFGGAGTTFGQTKMVRPYVFLAEIHRTKMKDAEDKRIDALSDKDAQKELKKIGLDGKSNPKEALKNAFMYARNYGALLHSKDGKSPLFIDTSSSTKLKECASKAEGVYGLAGVLMQLGLFQFDNIGFSLDFAIAKPMGSIKEKTNYTTVTRSMSTMFAPGFTIRYNIGNFALEGGVILPIYSETISVVAHPKGIDFEGLSDITVKSLNNAQVAGHHIPSVPAFDSLKVQGSVRAVEQGSAQEPGQDRDGVVPGQPSEVPNNQEAVQSVASDVPVQGNDDASQEAAQGSAQEPGQDQDGVVPVQPSEAPNNREAVQSVASDVPVQGNGDASQEAAQSVASNVPVGVAQGSDSVVKSVASVSSAGTITQSGMAEDAKKIFALLSEEKQKDNIFNTKYVPSFGFRIAGVYKFSERLSATLALIYIFGRSAEVEQEDKAPAKIVVSSDRKVDNSNFEIKVPPISRNGIGFLTVGISYKIM